MWALFFGEYNVLDEFSVGANIALTGPIELQGRRASDSEINDILKQVDLEGASVQESPTNCLADKSNVLQ